MLFNVYFYLVWCLFVFIQFTITALLWSHEKLLEKRKKLCRVYLFQQNPGELNKNKLNIKYVKKVQVEN